MYIHIAHIYTTQYTIERNRGGLERDEIPDFREIINVL